MCKSFTTTKTICPYCKGDKKVDIGWENLGHSRGAQRITEQCPVCKDEGITICETIYKPVNEAYDQKPINATSNESELNGESKKESNEILSVIKEIRGIVRKLLTKDPSFLQNQVNQQQK